MIDLIPNEVFLAIVGALGMLVAALGWAVQSRKPQTPPRLHQPPRKPTDTAVEDAAKAAIDKHRTSLLDATLDVRETADPHEAAANLGRARRRRIDQP